MTNHPDREHCEALKKAEWKRETKEILCTWNWLPVEWTVEPWCIRDDENVKVWLPCPSIGELLEALKEYASTLQNELALGFFKTIVSRALWADNPANAMADLWLWTWREKT